MNPTSTHTLIKSSHLRTLAAAAVLATAAGASHAGATVSIDYFGVSSQAGYVWTVDAYQRFQSDALQAGGLGGGVQSTNEAANWQQGSNTTAQTANAQATGVLTEQIEFWPQYLATPLFSLAASTSRGGSYGVPALPNYANALGLLAGGFTLIDFDGNALAGDITFTIYYTLNVASATNLSRSSDYAEALFGVDAYDDDEAYDTSLHALSSDFANGMSGDISGVLTWTFNLLAGEIAGFTVTGSAISSSAVPEPGVLALAATGMLGAGLARRRVRKTVTA